MKTRGVVSLVVLTAVVAWSAGVGFSEDEGGKPPMSEQEMWGVMMQWAQPGEHHKHLEALCGKWNVAGKMYSSMGAMDITGEAENKWILGGRFIETHYRGPFMGGEFKGRSFTGYDNGKKQYQTCWIMTMGTGMDTMTGTYDAESKTFTWKGKSYMPDGKYYAKRETITVESPTKLVSTVYSTPPGPGKTEVKEMEMTYTKVVEEEADK